jgi:hypothetical protein
MQQRGQHARQVVTEAGRSQLERVYCVCSGCGYSFFPLDAAWELDEGLYAGALKQNMAWLCGLLPYGQAAQVMARIGKRRVSESSLWRLVQQVGQGLKAQSTLEPPPEAGPATADPAVAPTTRLLSMDGGMVNIEGEGWKELKVGLVGTVIADEPASMGKAPSVHTTDLHYLCRLGRCVRFYPRFARLSAPNRLSASNPVLHHCRWSRLDLELGRCLFPR